MIDRYFDETQKFHIQQSFDDFGFNIWFSVGDPHNGEYFSVAQPVTIQSLTTREERYGVKPPMLHVGDYAMQQLMDELWRVGIRPTEGTGSAGSLAATERHLSDMQNIAYGLLKGKGVERK